MRSPPRLNALADDFDLVVATRDWHPPDHQSFQEQWPVHCVAGTPGAELHDGLDQSKVDVIVDKGQSSDTDGYSGFEGTDLEQLLKEHGHHAGHRRRAGDRLLRQEHRPGRPARGLPGHGRHHRRARRGRRAG